MEGEAEDTAEEMEDFYVMAADLSTIVVYAADKNSRRKRKCETVGDRYKEFS